MNIANIFSEEIHAEKATRIPHSLCLLYTHQVCPMSENLSNGLKQNWMRMGKKTHSYNWTVAESGSGAMDYVIM